MPEMTGDIDDCLLNKLKIEGNEVIHVDIRVDGMPIAHAVQYLLVWYLLVHIQLKS
jgi:hypothetical protein